MGRGDFRSPGEINPSKIESISRAGRAAGIFKVTPTTPVRGPIFDNSLSDLVR